jgi:hypothetical protein
MTGASILAQLTVLLSLFLSSSTSPLGWLARPLQPVVKWSSEASNDLRLFALSLKRYQRLIKWRVESSFEDFAREQLDFIESARNALRSRLDIADTLYNASLSALETQQRAIEELNNHISPRQRNYESLEQFRREFNTSLSAFKFPEMPAVLKKQLTKGQREMRTTFSSTSITDLTKSLEVQQNLLRGELSSRYDWGDRLFKEVMADIGSFQEETNKKAKAFLNESVESLLQTMNKRDMKKQQQELTRKYEELAADGSAWVERNLRNLETGVKRLQDTLSNTNLLYEELMNKRKNSFYYSSLNDHLLNRVLNLVDINDEGWSVIKVLNGVEVLQKFVSGRIACVKASTIINAPPEKILNLLIDNSRVHEYNSLAEPGTTRDVEVVSENTVVKWVRSAPMFPFKTRDFCTLYHVRKLKDGSIVVMSSATKHPEAPETSEYCRASIILAANIIEPIAGNSKKSKLTMLSQVDPGGIIPASVVNTLCANGPIGFFECVERCMGVKKS